jgi:hypothetical protein
MPRIALLDTRQHPLAHPSHPLGARSTESLVSMPKRMVHVKKVGSCINPLLHQLPCTERTGHQRDYCAPVVEQCIKPIIFSHAEPANIVCSSSESILGHSLLGEFDSITYIISPHQVVKLRSLHINPHVILEKSVQRDYPALGCIALPHNIFLEPNPNHQCDPPSHLHAVPPALVVVICFCLRPPPQ